MRHLLTALALLVALTCYGCSSRPSQPLSDRPLNPLEQRLVGQWYSGGMFRVGHTFSADGSYRGQLLTQPPQDLFAGTWHLQGNTLIRRLDDGTDHAEQIIEFKDEFFRVHDPKRNKTYHYERAPSPIQCG